MSQFIIESNKVTRDIPRDDGPGRSFKGLVLGHYEGIPVFTRLFLNLRWRFTPYEQIASHAPTQGLIYDLGCGHGLLALTLALQSPMRVVHAVDHDKERLRIARQTAGKLPNIQFQEGNFTKFLHQNGEQAAAIVVMDAMHYLNLDEQSQLVETIWASLVPGGLFLMRDVDPTGGLPSRINKVHEWAMTKTGFTKAERIVFRTPEQWENLFRQAGFCVKSKPCGCFPFSDRLFIGQKE